MSATAIIQARMGSKRFPGKTLYSLKGRPSIGHLLDAVRQVLPAGAVWVATSVNSENDPLAAYCEQQGVAVYRGDEENVASRFAAVLEQVETDLFVRLNADSPLLDYRTIERAISLARESGADIVSTVPGRRFPSGMNVEVLRRDVFLREYPHFSTAGHCEHVTAYFYEHAERFCPLALETDIAEPERYKFSFDTQDDKLKVEALFGAMERPHHTYTLREKCALYERLFPVELC